jgi:hypothetical protein
MTYPEQVERLRHDRWKESTEGQQAGAQYLKRMDRLKTRWRRASQEYKLQKAATNSRYEQARAKFLGN